MSVYTTEIASDELSSDNPIHQRLLKPYFEVLDHVRGDVLEVGCGEGRGVEQVMERAGSFTAIDKIQEVIVRLQEKYPQGKFLQMNIPPFADLEDNSFDMVISFQVIEHIRKDSDYLKEIHRVLRPGGKAFITTPNRKMTLSRNPWHIREYTSAELTQLASKIFPQVIMRGIGGNEKVMEYYEQNKASVRRIMKYDVLNAQYWLPAWLLRIPYEFLNRRNRNKLEAGDNTLVNEIRHEDYLVTQRGEEGLDLFMELEK